MECRTGEIGQPGIYEVPSCPQTVPLFVNRLPALAPLPVGGTRTLMRPAVIWQPSASAPMFSAFWPMRRRSPTLNVVAELLGEGMRTGLFRDDDVWEIAILFAAVTHGFVGLYHGGRIGLSEADFRALCHASAGRMLDGIKA